jgi:hypothetical protein
LDNGIGRGSRIREAEKRKAERGRGKEGHEKRTILAQGGVGGRYFFYLDPVIGQVVAKGQGEPQSGLVDGNRVKRDRSGISGDASLQHEDQGIGEAVRESQGSGGAGISGEDLVGDLDGADVLRSHKRNSGRGSEVQAWGHEEGDCVVLEDGRGGRGTIVEPQVGPLPVVWDLLIAK